MSDGICLCVLLKTIYSIVSVVPSNPNFLNTDTSKTEKNPNSLYIHVETNAGLSGLVSTIDSVVRVMSSNSYM